MSNVFKCKMCGGTLNINENDKICTCEYCGTKQTVPNLDTEKRSNLYDRANHFRRSSNYDRAMSIYEQILSENNSDFEAYWNICLCKYGVEYVEDPTSKKQIPTINRAQYNSILNDPDYLMSIKLADDSQKQILIEQANEINNIQKGILEISNKEKPFDIFICYKETDNNGRRSIDSVIAQDIYKDLTNEGYSVFFARITLEDKLGSAYEPYIFSALNSAKVMIVVGTSKDNLEAVWVRNEWSRYLSLINSGEKKVLIPCYKDMDPYDLPQEFSHLQAQDLNKIGFMQDLEHGIEKIIKTKKTTNNDNAGLINISSLESRVKDFIENEEWNKALEYCEKILDFDLNNYVAYEGRILAKYKIKSLENINTVDIKVKENILKDASYKHLYDNAEFKTKNFLDNFKLESYSQIEKIEEKKKEEQKQKEIEIQKRNKIFLRVVLAITATLVSFVLFFVGRNVYNKTIKVSNAYKKAIESLNANQADEAFKNFAIAAGHEYANEYLLTLAQNKEVLKNYLKQANPGDAVVLGRYEQNNSLTDGTEAIEWVILKNNHSNSVTLITKDIIDYDQIAGHALSGSSATSFVDSGIIVYLNDYFYNRAFNEYEKSLINPDYVDGKIVANVTLLDKLTLKQVFGFGVDNRMLKEKLTFNWIKNDPLIDAIKAKPSEMVKQQGGSVAGSKYMWYWLADPRYEGVEVDDYFSAITSKGSLSSAQVFESGGIRPVIKIKY